MRTVDNVSSRQVDEVVYVQIRYEKRNKRGEFEYTKSQGITIPGARLEKVVEVIRRAIREAA